MTQEQEQDHSPLLITGCDYQHVDIRQSFTLIKDGEILFHTRYYLLFRLYKILRSIRHTKHRIG